jgi:hypothetical protein
MSSLEALGMSVRHYRSHHEHYPGTILSGDEGHQVHYDLWNFKSALEALVLVYD